jgi:hypothetical protein
VAVKGQCRRRSTPAKCADEGPLATGRLKLAKSRHVRRRNRSQEETHGYPRGALRPTIARIWRGRTTAAKADYEHGIKPLAERALGVQMLREDRPHESEFVTISYWESVEAMARYAGDDLRRIHHLERDAEFLIELPSGVQVLDIAASLGRTGGDGS